MKETTLFNSKNGPISDVFLTKTLTEMGAGECDVLYIHTALNFGAPAQLKKKELLDLLLESILRLQVSTVIFPTYTFSFCNGVDYHLQNSKTPMGVLNEHARQKSIAIRSVDPLMSNALIGKHVEFVSDIGKCSIGANSTFDLLHKTGLKVKFLFLGPKIGDCFTHMHYMEEQENVPYRYRRPFTGQITNGDSTFTDTYELFVRYSNVFAGDGSYIYENLLLERGIAQRKKVGESAITILDEKPAYESYVELLRLSPSFYITEIFDKAASTTDFSAKNMVAL